MCDKENKQRRENILIKWKLFQRADTKVASCVHSEPNVGMSSLGAVTFKTKSFQKIRSEGYQGQAEFYFGLTETFGLSRNCFGWSEPKRKFRIFESFLLCVKFGLGVAMLLFVEKTAFLNWIWSKRMKHLWSFCSSRLLFVAWPGLNLLMAYWLWIGMKLVALNLK